MGILNDFLDLFFPRLCVVCNRMLMRDEHSVCLSCYENMPKTNFHLTPDNRMERLFWGKFTLEHACAMFYYIKGSPYQNIIHELKYRGKNLIGKEIGKTYGSELIECGIFNDIDLIIPVPLHKKKLRKRGYNQCEWIAMGISISLNKPYSAKLAVRITNTPTQTRKSVFERWENTSDIFKVVDSESIRNKHILIIDDVATTGSTLESLAKCLLCTEGVKVSVLTLAVV